MPEPTLPPIRVCLMWHQHQPYYRTGEHAVLPWVWLHSTKDYLEMAQHIKRAPEMRATINLVPSLLRQIRDYLHNVVIDPVLECMTKPSNTLSEDERQFMLEHFFYAHLEHVVQRSSRYAELFERAQAHRQRGASTAGIFSDQDFRDIAVHYALAWTGEFSRREEPARSLIEKDRAFTEDEKTALLAQHRKIVEQVIPLHATLCKREQIEITASPFYHPILPLLIDTHVARAAMPDVPLPLRGFCSLEDADRQIRDGRAYSESLFGIAPKGMWPSEGSVSERVLELANDAGYRWAATDEVILDRALDHDDHPELAKYFPWHYRWDDATFTMVFRDRGLSDLIGFEYQSWDPEEAANDFVKRVLDIRAQIANAFGNERLQHAMISVILDGENCWEYYPQNGYEFLSRLYTKLTTTDGIVTSTISSALDEIGIVEDRVLPSITPGSWIGGTFQIWIGHPEENAAWDALSKTKQALDRYAARMGEERITGDTELAERINCAHEELRIAEGSDWFWWYGDDHPSDHKAEFDELFRAHLRAVYALLDERVPEYLLVPIPEHASALNQSLPKRASGTIDPSLIGSAAIDGWENAIALQLAERGTMARASETSIEQIRVGWNKDEVFLRVLPANLGVQRLEVEFDTPAGVSVRFTHGEFGMDVRSNEPPLVVAARGVMRDSAEVAVPRTIVQDSNIRFAVHLGVDPTSLERVPSTGWLECRIG